MDSVSVFNILNEVKKGSILGKDDKLNEGRIFTDEYEDIKNYKEGWYYEVGGAGILILSMNPKSITIADLEDETFRVFKNKNYFIAYIKDLLEGEYATENSEVEEIKKFLKPFKGGFYIDAKVRIRR